MLSVQTLYILEAALTAGVLQQFFFCQLGLEENTSPMDLFPLQYFHLASHQGKLRGVPKMLNLHLLSNTMAQCMLTSCVHGSMGCAFHR